jgi:hypothetical protein
MAARGVVAAGVVSLACGFVFGSAGAFAGPRFSAPVFGLSDGYELTAADVDGDGNPDLATGDDSGAVSIVHGRGDGSFRRPVAYPSAHQSADEIQAADVNADNAPDLITAGSKDFRMGWVDVLLNDGAGRFHRDHR